MTALGLVLRFDELGYELGELLKAVISPCLPRWWYMSGID